MGNSIFFIRLGAIFGYVACTFIIIPETKASHSGLEVTKYLQQQYKGTVHSADGEVLVGASVRNVSKNTVTMTNSQGQFSLSGNSGDIVEVTYTGYKTIRLTLQSSSTLSVTLEEDANALDEIVVVGYNSLKKSNISGAVSTVDMGNAEKRRVQDVSQMLQGQVAGVNVTQSTGQPGDAIDIRIRGNGTIGNNSPLFIIDGVPTTNFSFINPADIESMSVLKDASAASIYGSRAAAGVILITTKKGKLGQTKFDANAYSGIQKVANLPEMMNTQQYLKTLVKAWDNSERTGTNDYTSQFLRTDLADTDWLDETFETGRTNSFQLGVSGGSDKIKYLISTGYYNQNGIVVYDNDKYERLNVRTNLQVNLTDRIDLKTNILLNNESKKVVSSQGDEPGIIRHALLRPPVLSVFKDPSDPTYKQSDPFTDLPFYKGIGDFQNGLYQESQNPVALAYFSNNKVDQFKLLGNAELGISFLQDKSLSFRSMLGIELNFNHTKKFLTNYGDEERDNPEVEDFGKGRINRPNMLAEDRGEDMNLTWNNVLTYNKTLNEDHLINALVGTEFINNHTSALNASRTRYEYIMKGFQYLDFGAKNDQLNNGGRDEEWALFSLFGSATYSYKNKYSVTGNLRADASSRFGPNKKWGYFPSVALSWVLSNEDFFPINDVLNYAKLRLSTGKLGNQSIGYMTYKTFYNDLGSVIQIGNPDLSWESTHQNNIGLDLRFLNNKLDLTLDAFYKRTSDMILGIDLPYFTGGATLSSINFNSGQVDNKGIELAAKYSDSFGGAFNYSIGGNISYLDNKVVSLHDLVASKPGTVTSAIPGQRLDSFYGLQMEGIYQNQAEIMEHQFNTTVIRDKPGNVRFKDVNNDGQINGKDETIIGNAIPKWTYGFFVNLNYKDFDLNAFFQGVKDVDRYNEGMQIINFDDRPFNYSTYMLGAWDGEGSSNSIPRLTLDKNGGEQKSSLHLEDASYLRLKNIEFGYSFGKYLNKFGINQARLYLSAQNVLTWTKYRGLDPEVANPFDRGTYPQSKAVLLGLTINF